MSKKGRTAAETSTDGEPAKDEVVSPEHAREKIISGLVGTKSALATEIETEAKAIEAFFDFLPEASIEELPIGQVGETPEDILNRVRAQANELDDPSVEGIARLLPTIDVALSNIRNWLQANDQDRVAMSQRASSLEKKRDEVRGQLEVEAARFFLARVFRGGERKKMSAEVKAIVQEIQGLDSEVEKMYARRRTVGEEAESLERRRTQLVEQKQRQVFDVAEEFFQKVAEVHRELKQKILRPEVIDLLNAELIAQKVRPELDSLEADGRFTPADSAEFLDLLKVEMAGGLRRMWNDPPEKTEKAEAGRRQWEHLETKSGYRLREITNAVTASNDPPADYYYEKIVDFLLREAAKESIEQFSARLVESLSPEQKIRLEAVAAKVIEPIPNWSSRSRRVGWELDLRKIPSDEIMKLSGLERWPVVKKLLQSDGLISADVFARVEEIIIDRLYREQLAPGGHESWPGTAAANKMSEIGNPIALPLLLRHIETSGSGHTNNVVVYAIEQLLKESNPEELEAVLAALPPVKRLLLETLVDGESYLSRFGKSNSRYDTCVFLQKGDLTMVREKITKILEAKGLDEATVKNYYLGFDQEAVLILDTLLDARAEVEHIIIESKLGSWIDAASKLLAALVNPKHGDTRAFPKRIIQEGLGVTDEETLAVFDRVWATKTFKDSGFERAGFLDGLVLLNSKENGGAVLEEVLSRYRGTREDPKRVRKIMQLLVTLENFGEYGFSTPAPEKVTELDRLHAELTTQLSTVTGKEAKKIKDRMAAIEIELRNLTGLKGVEEAMVERVVEVACRRLDLGTEYREKIKNNLETLLKAGIFEIVPTLAGNYDIKNEPAVKALLREVTVHIIDGDFSRWRYAHEKSVDQLAGLTADQIEFWKTNLSPITVEFKLDDDERVRRVDELKAAQAIMQDAKQHVLETQPGFIFSSTRVEELRGEIGALTDSIKSLSVGSDRQKLINQKNRLEAEVELISGILGIEQATVETFDKEQVIKAARELGEKVRQLDIPDAGLDLDQISKIFTVGKVESVSAYESDDAPTLLKVGVEPQETCQSWRSGGHNECLMAYVADSNKKVLNVVDNQGKIVARSILKLTNQRAHGDSESKTKQATLFVEKPYSLLPNVEVYRAFIRVLLTKAQGLGVAITFGRGFDESIIEIFQEEARSFNYEMREDTLDVFIPPSINKYEYSDSLGGQLTYFNYYRPLSAVTFEPVEKM